MLIIYNPVAGRRRAGLLWRVLDVLLANGVKLEVAETEHAGHAIELARVAALEGRAVVVAAGGDGTIAEVANGLRGSDTALGVIPLGTANVLAKEYGLPASPRALANMLAYKRTRPLWPGIARLPEEDHVFVQMAGFGFDGAVVHGLPRLLKRLIGRGAYVWQTLWESLTYDFPPLRVLVDGQAHEAASVVVSKGRFYGGPYVLAPNARPEAPGFQVVLFEHPGTLPALRAGLALPLGCLPSCPGVRILPASHVEFSGNAKIPAQCDGDALAGSPLAITNVAAPISLISS